MSARWVFAAAGILAMLVGTALWLGTRAGSAVEAMAPGAIFATKFADTQGQPQSLGRYQGRVLVVNFWATWCAPCREEMPAFKRLQDRWAGRGVQFVGLANEDPIRVERFGRDLAINYPLWVGGDAVDELSRRLGNRLGALPHTVLLDGDGRVLTSRVGPYSEAELEAELGRLIPKRT